MIHGWVRKAIGADVVTIAIVLAFYQLILTYWAGQRFVLDALLYRGKKLLVVSWHQMSARTGSAVQQLATSGTAFISLSV